MTRWLLLSIALSAVAFGGSLYVWGFCYDQLPEQVPIHWNAAGEADGFMPKDNVFGTFLLMPCIMAGIVLLTVVLPWLSPKPFSLDAFRNTYGYIMAVVTALMAYIHLGVLLGGLQVLPIDIGTFIIGGMFLFFALIGNVLGQVQRNFYMGVRTPWTLANDLVWAQTHRLAAWLYTAGGVVGLIVVAIAAVIQTVFQVKTPWLFIPLFVGFMLLVLFPVPYSFFLYKKLERQGKLGPAAGENAVS